MTVLSAHPTAFAEAPVSRLGPIVLATDGSPDAAMARRVAADLAARGRLAVHVISAWSVPVPAMAYGGYVIPEGSAEELEESARSLVEAECRGLAEAGVGLAIRHVAGERPAQAILSLADQVRAGLIVLGSRGLGPVLRFVMGSVSEEVVHHGHRPVLVVRGGAGAWPPARVVVGDDGSEVAASAVLCAAAVGAALGVTVTVTHVVPHVPQDGQRPPGMAVDAALAGARRPVEERVAALSRRAGVPLIPAVGVGEPAGALLAEADAGPGPGLVVVGSRGLGAMARIRHGSVSTRVLHAARASVLVVPPGPVRVVPAAG